MLLVTISQKVIYSYIIVEFWTNKIYLTSKLFYSLRSTFIKLLTIGVTTISLFFIEEEI